MGCMVPSISYNQSSPYESVGEMGEKGRWPRPLGSTNIPVDENGTWDSGLLKDISNRGFDPHVADEIAFGAIENPWPVMAAYRRNSPITPGEYRTFFGATPDPTLSHMKHYTAWRYDEVDAILSDPLLFSSAI